MLPGICPVRGDSRKAGDGIRTRDPLFTRQVLWPAELLRHGLASYSSLGWKSLGLLHLAGIPGP
jgi:hypothetical protein